MAIIIIIIVITSVGKDVEKSETTYTAGGNVNLCSHFWKKKMGEHMRGKNSVFSNHINSNMHNVILTLFCT